MEYFTIVSQSVSVIAIKKFSIRVDNLCNQQREGERGREMFTIVASYKL